MPLQPCRDCGATVSTEATACPKCGRPIKKGVSAARLIVTTIVMLFLFGVLANLLFMTR
jgi:hypothetical protein